MPSKQGAPSKLKRREWALLALASSPDHCLTPVQVQKTMFLLGENYRDVVGSAFYRFQPYNYGPFDVAVYNDIETLINDGLVMKRKTNGTSWSEYATTKKGIHVAGDLRERAPLGAARYLASISKWARGLTFSQLVRAIYSRYPAYRENSVFQD